MLQPFNTLSNKNRTVTHAHFKQILHEYSLLARYIQTRAQKTEYNGADFYQVDKESPFVYRFQLADYWWSVSFVYVSDQPYNYKCTLGVWDDKAQSYASIDPYHQLDLNTFVHYFLDESAQLVGNSMVEEIAHIILLSRNKGYVF